MSSKTGKLIVIEGLEGAGKTTAVNTIVESLARRHIPSMVTREPGGTAISEVLRQIIKSPDYKDVLNDKTELLLMYAARIQLIEQVIKPTIEKGTWVIADRFELSTIAYQGGGRGLDMDVIKQISAFALDGFKPDLILYLDISPEEGMRRVESRGESDRIEQQSIEFFRRVHYSYLQNVQTHPDAVLIDASLALPEVQQAIQKALNDFIEHHR